MTDGVTLMLGDCLDRLDELEAGSFDVVLTDPPFSSGTRKEGSKGIRKSMLRATEDDDWFSTDSLTSHGFVWLMRQNALRWKRLLARGGHAFVFIDWRMMPHLAAAVESADFRHVGLLVWDKTYFGMGHCFRNQHELILHFTNGPGRKPVRMDMGNVLHHPPIRDGRHPNEKPVPLLRDILSVVARPGNRVLDPFMGSGSTGVASVLLKCGFTGIDLDPAFVEISRDRLIKAPGSSWSQPSLFGKGEGDAASTLNPCPLVPS
jgi:site-specific DNA-methyltransferase (adenine-specific)